MGSSIDTVCKHCGEYESYILGVGIEYANLDAVIPITTGYVRRTLKEIIGNNAIVDADYEHVLYACEKCNTLHSRFWVRVEYDEDKVFETSFRCGKCRSGLVRAKQPIESYACKKCGRQELKEAPGILWD